MKMAKIVGFAVVLITILLGIYTVFPMIKKGVFHTTKSEWFNQIATPENPIVSPSGKYQLEVVNGYNGLVKFQRFYITKLEDRAYSPRVIFACLDTFRTRDTLYFLWDNNDRVWVYSGDVGTYYWVCVDNDQWEKYSYANTPILVPELLNQLRPEGF